MAQRTVARLNGRGSEHGKCAKLGAEETDGSTVTGTRTDAHQDPSEFGVGRLFWLTSDAIVAADLSTERIVLWNPAAERLFGYTAGEAVGMLLDRIVPNDLRDAHLTGVRRYAEGDVARLVGGEPVLVPAVTRSGDRRQIALTLTDVSNATDRRLVLAIVPITTRLADVSVAEAVAEASTRAGSNGIADLTPSLTVHVDPSHLERMLVNYLVNAAQYGHDPIHITGVSNGETATIRVCDRGAGVPDDFVPHLFTSFARAEPTRGNGTGLGLSIVKGR